jgi:nucleotide-binding universal stress UspA family protein
MSIARVLAPLTGTPRDQAVLAGAFETSKPFNAHVVALFVRPDPADAMPFYGEGMSSNVVQEIMDVSKRAADEAARKARSALVAAASAHRARVLDAPTPCEDLATSFQEVAGGFADQVTAAAKLSDLVVFGALREDDRPGLGEAFEATLIDVGRPVLLVSQVPVPGYAKRIAIAWNGSTASAHAVSAALPLLTKAEHVDVLTVRRSGAEPIGTDDLLSYLALHRVDAQVREVDRGERAVADVLLEAAAQNSAGMLVVGGFGHNRLRELFVTGTTRRVATQAALPCFLVH